jgi:hypothetical protein
MVHKPIQFQEDMMIQFKRPLLAAVMIGLILALGACGAQATLPAEPTTGIVQSSPAPTDTTAPTATTAATAEPTQAATAEATAGVTSTATTGEVLNPGVLTGTSDLNSFRSETQMSWQGTMTNSVEASGVFTMSVDFVREPPAQHLTLAGDAPFLAQVGVQPGQSMEMYVVSNTVYLNLGGTWLKTPAGSEVTNLDNIGLVKSEDLLKDVTGARYVGDETINGVQTKHYTFDETSIDASQLSEGSTIDSAQGDVWVAAEGNYVVRLEMSMTGKNISIPADSAGNSRMSNGTVHISVNLSDVNQPITITVPPEALNAGG